MQAALLAARCGGRPWAPLLWLLDDGLGAQYWPCSVVHHGPVMRQRSCVGLLYSAPPDTRAKSDARTNDGCRDGQLHSELPSSFLAHVACSGGFWAL